MCAALQKNFEKWDKDGYYNEVPQNYGNEELDMCQNILGKSILHAAEMWFLGSVTGIKRD
jgi:hypothetical protein